VQLSWISGYGFVCDKTGSSEIEKGNDLGLVAGVPSPMILRRNPGDDTFRVVGGTLVHGLMRGEDFRVDELEDITLA
jgi:hypothetical protein